MLPVNNAPIYTMTIPSTQQEVKYRPMVVREEKALLIAQQSESITVMLDSLKQVLKQCVLTPVNVDDLATFDFEYMFTQLRATSIDEIVELTFRCDVCTDEKAVGQTTVNLHNIKVTTNPTHTKKIHLFGDVGVMMKYPSVDTLKKLETSNEDDIDQQFDLIVDCIDYVYDSNEVHKASETDPQELKQFLENLTNDQYLKIQDFFATMPTLRIDVQYKCPVCGLEHNKYMEGLESFF